MADTPRKGFDHVRFQSFAAGISVLQNAQINGKLRDIDATLAKHQAIGKEMVAAQRETAQQVRKVADGVQRVEDQLRYQSSLQELEAKEKAKERLIKDFREKMQEVCFQLEKYLENVGEIENSSDSLGLFLTLQATAAEVKRHDLNTEHLGTIDEKRYLSNTLDLLERKLQESFELLTDDDIKELEEILDLQRKYHESDDFRVSKKDDKRQLEDIEKKMINLSKEYKRIEAFSIDDMSREWNINTIRNSKHKIRFLLSMIVLLWFIGYFSDSADTAFGFAALGSLVILPVVGCVYVWGRPSEKEKLKIIKKRAPKERKKRLDSINSELSKLEYEKKKLEEIQKDSTSRSKELSNELNNELNKILSRHPIVQDMSFSSRI